MTLDRRVLLLLLLPLLYLLLAAAAAKVDLKRAISFCFRDFQRREHSEEQILVRVED